MMWFSKSLASVLRKRFHVPIGFSREPKDQHANSSDGTPLAKLHGSIDAGVLIPPTWNKGLHPEIIPAWKLAYQVLSRANNLRFIGYSLPDADSYMRFVLRASVLNSEHLKRIDVLCLDSQGDVRRRYDAFITFGNYRFCQGSTESYLGHLLSETETWPQSVEPELLERAHEAAFRCVK